MSGHSKWANIKRRKESQDATRGKVFGKLIREITVAARMGGPDPNANSRLRTAVDKARGANMPNNTIERAIKKGSGEGGADTFEEITYEGYGPNGVAVMVDAITDNRNRTTAEVRHIFSKYGGNLGQDGCVSWVFETKGIIQVAKDDIAEERLMEIALESGAEDVVDEEEYFEVLSSPEDFATVSDVIKKEGVNPISAEITRRPTTMVALEETDAMKILKLLDLLQDNDDVQQVSSNFDVSEEIMERLGQE